MQNKVYLDNASTTHPCKNVLENIKEMTELFYNPSSFYELSTYNKYVIEKTREKIAKIINCSQEEIIFTSGASESNSLAIDGFLKANEQFSVVSTNIEHDSIMMNPNITGFIECNKNGFCEPSNFSGYNNTLFACQLVNNQIGTIQPIIDISEQVHKDGNYLFVDATTGFGHIPIDVEVLGIDMMSFTSHKMGGIVGVGCLYVKKGINIKPIIYGHQEESLRGGTYNALAIKCFGLALDQIDYKNEIVTKSKRNFLIDKLLEIDGVHLNGSREKRLCSNVNIRIDNVSVDSQQLVSLLDMNGFMISAGSACDSGNDAPSHVLKAIGLSDEQAKHSIRITIEHNTSVRDLEDFTDCLKNIIKMYKI